MSQAEYARKLKAFHDELRRQYPRLSDEQIEDCCILPETFDAWIRSQVDLSIVSQVTT